MRGPSLNLFWSSVISVGGPLHLIILSKLNVAFNQNVSEYQEAITLTLRDTLHNFRLKFEAFFFF